MLSNFHTKIIPLLSQSQKIFTMGKFGTLQKTFINQYTISSCLYQNNKFSFSTYFDNMDQDELKTYNARKYQNKKYRALLDLWKKPLERKRKRQQRIRQIKQQLPIPATQPEKLIVHNPAVGIKYPPTKDQIFCVIKVDGFQYKITQDCVVILDTKQDHQINKTIKFDVLLAGTPSYTVLGRPLVDNTYVQGIIQSISDSQKTIVFKKKRRKQYKKSFGSRVSLTSCRITRIVHELKQQILQSAVSLIQPVKEETQRKAQKVNSAQ